MINTLSKQDVIVYLFTGFIESGKTSFIQRLLEDRRFGNGKRTLVLLCEEGATEFATECFSVPNVAFCTCESESDFTEENLSDCARRFGADRILVEYNGMWSLDTFFSALPDNWILFQSFFFADSTTILMYNANLRQLTYDKLSRCSFIVFNRVSDSTELMPLHKLVRAASSQAKIIFEYTDGHQVSDPIEDTLPYDMDSDPVVVHNCDFAFWYRDVSEHRAEYENRAFLFDSYVPDISDDGKSTIIGRQIMFCCASDMQFGGFQIDRPIKSGEWIRVTGRLLPSGDTPPKMHIQDYEKIDMPEEPIATFS